MNVAGWLTLKTKVDTDDFDSQIKYIETQLEDIEYKLKQADMGFEVGDTVKLEAQYEKLYNQLTKLKQKQDDINNINLSNLQKQIDKSEKGISKVIKRMGKWALAVFTIESAYGFVRQSISTLSQYNEKIAADIQYIRYAMASALQPIIEKFISLVYRLLQYINYIAQAWFGVNLFANASADAMNKSAKSAKEMKKSLAGFDEMNTVSSANSNTGATGAAGVDLSNMQGKIPGWLQWLGDNKEVIVGALFGIASGIAAMKISDLVVKLGLVEKGLTGIQTLGIGVIIAGIVLLIQDVIDCIKDPSWENIVAILGDMAIVIGGIMLLMGNWWGLLVSIIGLIVKLVVENWDKIKGTLGTVGSWIYTNIIQPIYNFFEPLFSFFVNLFTKIWNNVKTIVSNFVTIFTSVFSAIKKVFSPIVNFFGDLWNKIKDKLKSWGAKIGDIVGNAFKTVINSVLKTIENVINTPIKAINKLIGVINKVPGIELSKLQTFSLPRLKTGGIVNLPSRGVPVGGAIAGEAGAEGVIPLTNSQAMEELGSAIGRYITINLTNNTNLDGRTIARQQSKVQANRNFAMNR